jgi:hypothetical protein
MEQQDFTPIGGNWQQDAAYSLRQIITQASDLLQKFDENGELIVSAITQSENNVIQAIDDKETIVEITSYNIAKRQIIYVNNPLPIVKPKPNQKVVYKKETIQPAPNVIDIAKRNAYWRVCGAHPSPQCKDCVDAWLLAHKNGFQLKDLTSTGTGCRFIRQSQPSVSPRR